MSWTIVTLLGRDSNGDRVVEAWCHCGKRRYIRLVTITNGQSKSCGCVRKEATKRTQFQPKQTWYPQ